MNHVPAAFRILLPSVMLALVSSGCGYRIGPGGPGDADWSRSVRTIAVPIFQNESWRQGLEFELTNQFIEQVQLRTPIRVVDPARAEAVVMGTVRAVRDRERHSDRNDRIAASQVEITGEVKVIFPASGRIMGPYQRIEVAEYVPLRGEDRESATREALRDLARELVLNLASVERPYDPDGEGPSEESLTGGNSSLR